MKRSVTHSAWIMGLSTLLWCNSVYSATPDQAAREIQTKMNAQQFDAALEQAKAVLSDSSLSPPDRARFLKLTGDVHMRVGHERANDAAASYRAIFEDPQFNAAQRIDAARHLANAIMLTQAGRELADMDPTPAVAVLKQATELPGLNAIQQATAWQNLAVFQQTGAMFDDAFKSAQKMLDVAPTPQLRTRAHQILAEIEAAQGNLEHAVIRSKEHGLNVIPLYSSYGTLDQWRQACMEVIQDSSKPLKDRWNALVDHPSLLVHQLSSYWPEATELIRKHGVPMLEENPNNVTSLIARFNQAVRAHGHAAYQGPRHDFVLLVGPYYLKGDRIPESHYRRALSAVTLSLGATQQHDAWKQLLELTTHDPKASPMQQAAAALVLQRLNASQAVDSKATLKVVETLENQVKSDALVEAARLMLAAGRETDAQQLYETQQSLLSIPARAEIVCRFDADGPFDMGSWMNSPVLKRGDQRGVLDRPYGSNLKFLLETDATTTGRGVDADAASKGGAEQQTTEFFVSCNEHGLSLFFKADEPQMEDVVLGKVRGGSYEMYIAPGEYQPYYTFLERFESKETIDPKVMVTLYPNAQHRQLDPKEGTFRSQTIRRGNQFYTTIFLGWEGFYNKIPADNDRWEFDAIRWTRSGGLSFGGSQSVHNRSSWGDIRFANMTPENRLAIKRNIVLAALSRYKEYRKAIGPALYWNDVDLGDPQFHNAHVKPILDRMDAYAKRINDGLTPEVVNELYENAVPVWMALPHHIDLLRAQYVQSKLFE